MSLSRSKSSPANLALFGVRVTTSPEPERSKGFVLLHAGAGFHAPQRVNLHIKATKQYVLENFELILSEMRLIFCLLEHSQMVWLF
jgi:hypothetical protein